jgi:putative transposase
MAETATVGRRRRGGQEPSPDEVLAEELVERARSEGVELLGDGGLLQQMTKAVLERGLAEELTEHLGYEPHDPVGNGSGNSRNGSSSKRVHSEAGTIELDVRVIGRARSSPSWCAKASVVWAVSTRS